jgi:hypothetical protein
MLRGFELDQAGLGSCPLVGFSVSSVEASYSTTRVLQLINTNYLCQTVNC